jgi:hypothetical protein
MTFGCHLDTGRYIPEEIVLRIVIMLRDIILELIYFPNLLKPPHLRTAVQFPPSGEQDMEANRAVEITCKADPRPWGATVLRHSTVFSLEGEKITDFRNIVVLTHLVYGETKI